MKNFVKNKLWKSVIKFNDWLAVKITQVVGTVWTVYAFSLLVTIPVFVHSLQESILYFSSSVLQLILLPAIMVGQSLMNKRSEKRAEADHKMIMDLIKEVHNLKSLVQGDNK